MQQMAVDLNLLLIVDRYDKRNPQLAACRPAVDRWGPTVSHASAKCGGTGTLANGSQSTDLGEVLEKALA